MVFGSEPASSCSFAASKLDDRPDFSWNQLRTSSEPASVMEFGFRQHCSTPYVDASYCYRPRSVVCRSVCLSVTVVSPAKTAESIEMSFSMWTWVDPKEPFIR